MTNQNNSAQAAKQEGVLTDDEINDICEWPASNTTMRAENDRALARAIESALLSRLRAPVAGEAQQPVAVVRDNPEDYGTVIDAAIRALKQPQADKDGAEPHLPDGSYFPDVSPEGPWFDSDDVRAAVLADRQQRARDTVGAAPAERAEFETWAEGAGLIVKSHGLMSINHKCDAAWEAWKARAVLASAPVAMIDTAKLAQLLDSVNGDFYLGKEKEEELVQCLRSQLRAPVADERAAVDPCGYVAVKVAAVDWLKDKFPALTIKAGLCERIGGRLYTITRLMRDHDAALASAPVAGEAVAWRALDGHGLSQTDWIDGDPGPDAQSAWIGGRIERAYAAPQVGPVAGEVQERIEQMAVNRYRPVPDGKFSYKVVAGDGSRSLYTGTKDSCLRVAAKLTEAFLDGAFVASDAAPQASTVAGEARPWSASDTDLRAWAERHGVENILKFPSTIKAAIDDARSLHLVTQPETSAGEAQKPVATLYLYKQKGKWAAHVTGLDDTALNLGSNPVYAAPRASAMPPLNDAMRAVISNERDVYQTPEALYAALCDAARDAHKEQS